MGGGPGHLAVMADCERALGYPERAIELSRSAAADDLDPEAAAELSIVVAGARADLGQYDAALAHLERVGLDRAEEHPRLAYAYADLLLKAGRGQEALSWFIRSANADAEEVTDALDRVAALSAAETTDEAETAAEAASESEAAGAESEGFAGASTIADPDDDPDQDFERKTASDAGTGIAEGDRDSADGDRDSADGDRAEVPELLFSDDPQPGDR